MPSLLLISGGLVAGVLAGLLGIGGGTVLVPILLLADLEPVQAVATSSLAIIVTASSGTLQNWRMGAVRGDRILAIGLPAVLATQLGVRLAAGISPQLLLIAFGCLMLVNLYLLSLRQRLLRQGQTMGKADRTLSLQVLTGVLAGAIAGLLGVGGGAIMVPLQMLFLQEPIKKAIQTSLAVVVMTAIASTVGHAAHGNVQWISGLTLGFGGLLTAQLSTRLLPKLPEAWVRALFRTFLLASAAYSFWRAAGLGR